MDIYNLKENEISIITFSVIHIIVVSRQGGFSIKTLAQIVLVIIFFAFFSSVFFPEWTLEVWDLIKKPATFISFLTTSLGIMGAYFVANYQFKKTLKFSNPQYLQNFNMAQLHIEKFIELTEKITDIICTSKRVEAKYKISWSDYKELEGHLLATVETLNPKMVGKDIRKELLMVIKELNEYAPPYAYYSMNGLIYYMIDIHDSILMESKNLDLYGSRDGLKVIWPYLVKGMEPKISHRRMKKFKRLYKKQIKQLDFKNRRTMI